MRQRVSASVHLRSSALSRISDHATLVPSPRCLHPERWLRGLAGETENPRRHPRSVRRKTRARAGRRRVGRRLLVSQRVLCFYRFARIGSKGRARGTVTLGSAGSWLSGAPHHAGVPWWVCYRDSGCPRIGLCALTAGPESRSPMAAWIRLSDCKATFLASPGLSWAAQ
jgi:hypothetical protein